MCYYDSVKNPQDSIPPHKRAVTERSCSFALGNRKAGEGNGKANGEAKKILRRVFKRS